MVEDISPFITLFQHVISASKETDISTVLISLAGVGLVGGLRVWSRKLLQKVESVLDSYKKGHTPNLPALVNLGLEFTAEMDAFIKRLGASRALVYQFHNGEKLLDGSDYLKTSCTYEFLNQKAAKKIITPVQKDYINIPLSFFDSYLKKFKEEPVFHVDKSVKGLTLIKDYMERFGIQGMICAELKCKDDYPYGFIVFEFHSDEKRNLNRIKTTVKSVMPRIETMLGAIAVVQDNAQA